MLVKLKDICEIKSSKRIFESEYVTSGVPFIRGQEVSEKTLFKANSYNCYITEKRYTELKNKYGVPKRGDILITAVGTVGNVCYIDSDLKFYYKDGNLIQLTNFKNNINSLYLYYYLQSKYFQKQLNNILIGAVQKALTMSMLNEIVISIPPKNIQEKIVKILRFFDKQIECCEDMVKRLQVMGQGIFNKFFSNENTFISLLKFPYIRIIKPGIDKFKNNKKYVATAEVDKDKMNLDSPIINFETRENRANMQPVKNSV